MSYKTCENFLFSSLSLLGKSIEDEIQPSSMLGVKVNKLSKFFIKTSNEMKYIEFDIQNTKAPRIDDPYI